MLTLRIAALAALTCLALPTQAQTEADWPSADAADVATIDAIMGTVYSVISGPSTQERDWDRFRSLMHPQARLIPTGQSGTVANVMSVGDYVTAAGRSFRDSPVFQGKGFYEVEAARRTERYGSVAHVWSTYESRLDPSEAPFARGINSFQLFWDGTRWHVMTILWHQETDDTPIPAPYLVD